MPARALTRPRPRVRPRTARALLALACITATPIAAEAQLIRIRTLPIADVEQWGFFPSASLGMAGVSIALADSLLDPFVNPAKGGQLGAGDRALRVFGSPTFFSVSRNGGGGQTLPLGALLRSGATFGGFALAIQELDAPAFNGPIFAPCANCLAATQPAQAAPSSGTPSRNNEYAFAMFGRRFDGAGLAVAASALWSGLGNVDGVDLLYAGSQSIRQHGSALDARLGVVKRWEHGRTLEAVLLHHRYDVAHDVTWPGFAWDPNVGGIVPQPRLAHNLDRSNSWGLHFGYMRPLADSGWRIGGIATANLMSHPELPEYQIAQVTPIPWDPGRSAAYNVGVGLARMQGPTTFGLDAVYEPILSHTWGEAHAPTATQSGATIPIGGKTTENRFRFSNAILRTGVSHEVPIDSLRATMMRLQLGIGLHSVRYTLDQYDHALEAGRRQNEGWMEWTRTWGVSFRRAELELRYVGRLATGTGRPGIVPDNRRFVVDNLSAGSNILAPPDGPLTLTAVKVTTHQVSISLPIR